MVRFQLRIIERKGLLSFIHRSQRLLERYFKISEVVWGRIPKVEKGVLAFLLAAVVVSGIFVERNRQRELVASVGGTYIEGVVGAPNTPNPLYDWSNQVDSDLSKLIFSSLVKQGAGREFLPDLATSWQIENGGKIYTLPLKNNVFWQDGAPFTADDVIFTVGLIQNDVFKGVGAKEWQNIKAEKIDDYTVRFTLPNPNAFFLRQLTLGILPAHLLSGAIASDLALASNSFNQKPIGTGPYELESTISREQATLKVFDRFYDVKPYISRIVFRFVPNEKSLASLYLSRVVTGAGFRQTDAMESVKNLASTTHVERPLSQYKAIFFNPESAPVLADKAVRQALAYGIDRAQIIKNVESGHAVQLNSPIPDGFIGHDPSVVGYNFDVSKAAATLKADGFADADKNGILEKNGQPLILTLTYQDDSRAAATAQLIRDNWRLLGVNVILKPVPVENFVQTIIRPRDYQVLLFGQDLGSDPDPYLYWHSSQTKDPGLNLSLFYDKDIDNNLESARTTTNDKKVIGYYLNFQKAFNDLVPAILLYQPTYMYLLDTKIKGVNTDMLISSPSDRFTTISNWYIKTKQS